jgi:hypothetical protein
MEDIAMPFTPSLQLRVAANKHQHHRCGDYIHLYLAANHHCVLLQAGLESPANG